MHDIIHAFIESYQNGFYPMQTNIETISAYLGNLTYMITHII